MAIAIVMIGCGGSLDDGRSLRVRLTEPPPAPGERTVEAFYCFDEAGCPGETSLTVPAARLGLLVDALVQRGDFFGFVDASERVLQVRYEAGGGWVEVPILEERGSYGCLLAVDSLHSFVATLPTELTRDALPCAEPTFEPWPPETPTR